MAVAIPFHSSCSRLSDMDSTSCSECFPAFYHPHLTDMDMVIEVMKPYTLVNGAFLMRKSFSKHGVLTMSVIHDCSVKHFQISHISQQSGDVYILDRQFQTLEDLVEFYSEHDVPNLEAVTGVRLTCPIDCLANETLLHDDLLRDDRLRRVSAGDVAHIQDAHHMVSRVSEQLPSESRTDTVLLAKNKTLQRKLFESLKWSSKKNRRDVENVTTRLITSQQSDEVTSVQQSRGSFSENPKKYGKQPAIPDDVRGPALPNVRKNSGQSAVLFAGAADADGLAAAAEDFGAAATADLSLYYSEPRNVDRDMSSDFIARLVQQDKQDHTADGKCVCGLYLADSELPHGWSMHISTECGTEGRLFFTSPTGETSWELPTIVSVDLDPEQQDRIRQLMIEGQGTTHRVFHQQVSVTRQLSSGDKHIAV